MSPDDPKPPKALMAEALEALQQTRRKLERLERERSEPIAVVGAGCRLPGGVRDPDELWRLLVAGTDTVGEVPPERWDAERYYDPDPDHPGTMATRSGAFLDDPFGFDPAFFEISPREALYMDPQQRLLLEVAWEALEDAVLAPSKLRGSATGVFVGISTMDWAYHMTQHLPRSQLEGAAGTGTSHSAAAGRLSYFLGLTGPAVALDTACSSSLVALHLACESLRRGDCSLALAGGVNMLLSPLSSIAFSRAHMLAPDGRCKAFSARADGYGRGEGAGLVVLRRLSEALRDGDRILAEIVGSALNQDGASGGLTVPNGPSQVAVIREALERAAVEPGAVDYVEAHGTGTSLGDPLEMGALEQVFAPTRRRDHPLHVGSVKTNFGHLEAAAGIAGFLKAVLQLRHHRIVPHLHLDEPSPHIPWERLPVEIPRTATPWPQPSGRRHAGVSSFGFTGTNAHVVVREPAARDAPAVDSPEPVWLQLSARSPAALADMRRSYATFLRTRGDLRPADVAFSAARGRSPLRHRLAVRGTTLDELVAGLEAGGQRKGALIGQVREHLTDRTLVVFGEKLRVTPAGLTAICARWPALAEGLETETSERIDGATRVLSLQVALASAWAALGREPDLVWGTGPGRIAAAVCAGALSLPDGLRLAAAWGTERWSAEVAATGFATPRRRLPDPGTTLDASWVEAGADLPANDVPQDVRTVISLDVEGSAALRALLMAAGWTGTWIDSGDLAGEDPLVAAAGPVFVGGVPLEPKAFWRGRTVTPIRLPTYPFDRNAYGIPRRAPTHDLGTASHPLMGDAVAIPGVDFVLFQTQLSPDTPTWLRDHEAAGVAIVPAGALLEALAASAAARLRTELVVLEDVTLPEPLPLGEGCTLQVRAHRPVNGATRLVLEARRADGPWFPVGRAVASVGSEAMEPNQEGNHRAHRGHGDGAQKPAPGRVPVPAPRPRDLREAVVQATRDGDTAHIELGLSPLWQTEARTSLLHPILWEGALMAAAAAGTATLDDRWPSFVRRVQVESASVTTVCCSAYEGGASVQVAGADGDVLAQLDGVSLVSGSELGCGSAEAALATCAQPRWESTGPAPEPPTQVTGTWVVLADAIGVGDRLAGELRRRGARCLVARAGERLQVSASGPWTLDPREGAQIRSFLATAAENGDLQGVVHLWSLDPHPGPALAEAERLVRPLLPIIDRLETTTARLHVVTSLRGGDAPPLHGLLRGLLRVIGSESPVQGGSFIALEPGGDDALLAELMREARCEEVRLGRGTRHVLRIVPAREQGPDLGADTTIRPDGAYLVTGGTGALGREVSRWLLDRGARHLVLLSRTPDEGIADEIRRHRPGAHVDVVAGDAADRIACQSLLADLPAERPLRGVFHLAGVLEDRVLSGQTWDAMERVLAPKVAGAWNLHELTAHADLDLFVLFSSAAATLGSPGQGSYAAANGFLDALAAARRAQGRHGLAIAWGPWARSGMAARLDVSLSRFESLGIRPLEPKLALSVLQLLISCNDPEVTALDVDWERYREALSSDATAPRLQGSGRGKASAGPGRGTLLVRLQDTPDAERRELLETSLAAALARVLQLPSVDRDRPFTELGLDSLMGVELRNRMQGELQVTVPMKHLLSGGTITGFATLVLDLLVEQGHLPPTDLTDVDPALIADLEQLSEEEVRRLLSRGDEDG